MESILESGIDREIGAPETDVNGKSEIGDKRERDISIPVKILESCDYFVVEAAIPGLTAEEISVFLTSRIITISTRSEDDVGKGNDDKRKPGRGKYNVSLYLDSSIDPGFSMAHYSRGQLYMKMLKNPGASVHTPVCLPVSG